MEDNDCKVELHYLASKLLQVKLSMASLISFDN